VPPEPAAPPGQFGFKFDRLGVRVPAVLVSAYVEPGTIVDTTLCHASMIRTISEKWQLGHLTERDRAAASLGETFNRSIPRARAQWPTVKPRAIPPDRGGDNHAHPLNAFQSDVVELAVAVAGDWPPHPSDVATVLDAIRTMRRRLERQQRELKK
jgi:phospholipase C